METRLPELSPAKLEMRLRLDMFLFLTVSGRGTTARAPECEEITVRGRPRGSARSSSPVRRGRSCRRPRLPSVQLP